MFLQVVLLKNGNNYEEKALMKFAYLIIVHTRFDQVAKLLELLDDEKMIFMFILMKKSRIHLKYFREH